MSWLGVVDNGPDLAAGELSSPWLVDEFVACYVCWREQCAAVRGAYERWSSAERGDRALAFAAYIAALDREERAARAYAECGERIAAA